MLRGSDKRLFTSGQLEHVFGGRLGGFPDALPGHMMGAGPPVTGAVGWYDASDTATITHTAGNITAWADKSGNANDLTLQGGNPVLGRNSQGVPVVWFDGLLSQLGTTAISMSDRTFTCVATVMPTQVTRFQAIVGPNNDGGNVFRIDATTGRLTTNRVDVAAIGTQSNAAFSAGVPGVAAQVLTATDVTHYLNLTSETDADANAFTANRNLRVGMSPSTTSPFDAFIGWIGEIVIYDTSLSSGDVQSVISYMMGKWGIV